MSIINPKSSDFLAGSSLGFVKPMPRRGLEVLGHQGDSAEFDVAMIAPKASAIDLWRRLQPDPEDLAVTSTGCAGIMLGHFRIEEQIGRGGMGAVFRALDTRLDREVALKVLAGTQSTDKSSVDRFRNEARAAARLDHDNVARVFYVGEESGLHFIAFEFIHGANVRQVIDARGTLSPAEAVNYGLQIAHALRHVAAAGVVHRDVKPSNIIITPTGRAKLVDLGLARKHDPEASRDLTVDGTTLGTFDYISPEQAKDPRCVDIRSDIYSLGCTLYHMLTGEPPYPRGTMLQKLLDHQHKDVPHASARNGNVPPELSAVVRKMMASDPAERYATADELIGDLSILAHAYGLRPIAPGSVVWAPPERVSRWSAWRRHRAWIVTAALLVAGVLTLDAIQSASSTSPLEAEPLVQVQPETPAESTAPPVAPLKPTDSTRPEASPSGDGSRPLAPPVAEQFVTDSTPPSATPSGPSGMTPKTDGNGLTAEGAANVVIYPGINLLPDGTFAQLPFVDSITPSLIPNSVVGEASAVAPGGAEASTPPDASPGAPPLPPPAAAAPAEPFLVRVEGEEPLGFVSLEAACRSAPDGGVIELNFDGRLAEQQRPVRIDGKRLRIRRAPGRQPIVHFAVPEEWQSAEVVRMISVSRGSLEIYDVGFEVKVNSSFITEQWVFLSLSQADEVILRGVSLTMRNANLSPAALVELAEASARFNDRMPEAMDQPPVRLEAEDCFFRGQADLFLSESVDPARIRLSNVGIALDGSLMHLRGVDAIDVLADMNDEHRVELDLRHITALLAGEVLRFEIAPGMSVPRVAVTANNSVLVGAASRPLVSMSGEIDLFDAQQLLEWFGDHCFVQTPDPIWSITGPTDERDYGLSEWNDLWKQGRLQRSESVNLLRRDRSIPYSDMSAADLTLIAIDGLANPAVGGASDGADAGVRWTTLRLPTLQSSGGN